MSKSLTILYFAWLRERIGASSEAIALPDGVDTVAALLDVLSTRSPGHAAALQQRRLVRAAVNQQIVELSSPVRPGDEVAFFPPVTGG